jgi:hypothetical protein
VSTPAGSDRARRIAIRLLRWYPRPWRLRYGREMRALIDQMPVGWSQVMNLAGAAARAWFSPRALGWPAKSAAGRVQFARAVLFFVCAFSIDAVARIIASRLRSTGFEITETMGLVAALLFVAFSVRVFGAIVAKGRSVWAQKPRVIFQLSDWEVCLWCVLLMPSQIVRHAETTPSYLSHTMVMIRPYITVLQIYTYVFMASQSSKGTQRLMRIQSAYLTRRKQRERALSVPSSPLGL